MNKGQNQLLPEHIEKILSTYQGRTEEKRYSRCVDMEEIEKNDFNFNISRYVSTVNLEKPVDLQAVNDELNKVEKKNGDTTRRHNDFLAELGLPPLPFIM